MELPFAESFRIKMIEPIYKSSREERLNWIQKAKYNLFNIKSNQVFVDLLTDSGTGAMSDKQWSEMMLGDESYAGASSYYKLKNAIKNIMGFDYFLPTHQGRAAENVLFSVLVKEGDIVPGNSHFDTTKGHIEFRKATAVDCTIDEAFDTTKQHPFKGNVDLNKLDDVLKSYASKVPFVIITITNNTAGGQPVDLDNIKEVYSLCQTYGKMLIFDSARFAENAYFIKQRNPKYANSSIKEIVKEIYSYADATTMSAKKDAIVNMGGFIGMKSKSLFDKASVYNIMFEGFITYGGMSGRDMNALAQGLDENTEFSTLENRIEQVAYLGRKLVEYGVPVQEPFGGHAIFVDAKRFFPHIPKEHYLAQTLAVETYIEGGVRGVEIGSILADRDPITKLDRFPKLELMRLAIPRRTYTNNHMDYVAATLGNVFERRNSIKSGFRITHEAPILRHFTVELERI
ncbi:MAG: tyrosine phenol-lyase [Bacteroidetes bacterium CG2_30_33_31]|nr:MAG: tyrosine phenol-lyase [Bacteroidetes bacterium CG2_30_33_31]